MRGTKRCSGEWWMVNGLLMLDHVTLPESSVVFYLQIYTKGIFSVSCWNRLSVKRNVESGNSIENWPQSRWSCYWQQIGPKRPLSVAAWLLFIPGSFKESLANWKLRNEVARWLFDVRQQANIITYQTRNKPQKYTTCLKYLLLPITTALYLSPPSPLLADILNSETNAIKLIIIVISVFLGVYVNISMNVTDNHST